LQYDNTAALLFGSRNIIMKPSYLPVITIKVTREELMDPNLLRQKLATVFRLGKYTNPAAL
ncbi:12309_t:CDS:2, partial [Cetraspora pellucida]